MGILFKITLTILVSLVPLYVLAHKVTLEDKSLEKIVNERMAIMQKIKSTSSKLYRLINSDQYEEMLELNETLLHQHLNLKIFIQKIVKQKELVIIFGVIVKHLMNITKTL